jgi:serine/threonine protein phosphatase PrpC
VEHLVKLGRPRTDAAACTHRGMRERNEDAVRFGSSGVAVVADGVGGQPDGARASGLAAEAAYRWLVRRSAGNPISDLMALPAVGARAMTRTVPPLHPRAASGLAAAAVHHGRIHLVAVGDCRATVLRQDTDRRWCAVTATSDHDGLSLLARDYVAGLRAGLLPARPSPQTAADAAGVLQDAIRPGSGALPEPVVLSTWARPGDIVLLTTDGVHDTLGDAGLRRALAAEISDADELSSRLVAQALAQGATDNCTAAAVRIVGRPCSARRAGPPDWSRRCRGVTSFPRLVRALGWLGHRARSLGTRPLEPTSWT